MQVIKKERNSNLELYRIIVMLAIIAHHYVMNSGLLKVLEQDPISTRSIYYYLFGAWGKTGINCFVLITGYFMCKSHITIEKFLKLLLEVMFYKIVISGIFIVSGYEHINLQTLIFMLLPIASINDSFTDCFLLFFLCIPFLNIMVKSMTKLQHKYLLILLLGIYTGLGTLLPGRLTTNYVTWFCVLYFISSYIRLYQPFPNVRWATYLGGAVLLSIVSVISILIVSDKIGVKPHQYYFISDSYKLLAVVVGVSMFMWFKDMKIPQSRIINRVAQSCFGVLLIHANSDTMRHWLWKDTLDVVNQYWTNSFIFHSVLSVVGIYVACTILDQIRIYFIEKPLFGLFKKQL